ncbi:MAG TPA: DUF87 domain-containing protein, partial [Candidatus Brocadiales bacterium]|nr:DUF87 domain-containing protein [Candidatus Brocadiales bacterium]
MSDILGQVIAGSFERVLLRKKSGAALEIGSLAIAEVEGVKILLQVSDLTYGSQLSQQDLELVSGLKLEESGELELEDKELRNYTIAVLKPLITINGKDIKLCKTLPGFFSYVRGPEPEDLAFLVKPDHALLAGFLRSGSRIIEIPIFLDAQEVLSHHVLIPAQTGKGKSNLAMCLLLENMSQPVAGMLVLDPHDEYYGRTRPGLKNHPSRNSLVYYTAHVPPAGSRSLSIHIRLLKPSHFLGVMPWSDPQIEALYAAYK